MEATPEKLIRDIKVVVQDAEELIRATSGDFGDKTREARAKLAGALVVAKDTCHRLEDEVRVKATQADSAIRGHPYQFLGAAFAVGVLIGALLNRK